MRAQSELFRLTGLLTITGLLTGPVLAERTWAQGALPLLGAPPPGAPPPAASPGPPAPDVQPAADPPARVGRLALVTGTVSLHTPADADWSPASLNYPVSSGNSFWTQPDAEADLELGGTRIAMAGATEFDLYTLDDSGTNATLPQGEIYLNVRVLQPNEAVTLQTPRGTVSIAAPGQYGVFAGDTSNATVVTVISGAAQVGGANLTLNVGPGQAATISGTDTFQGSVGPAAPDGFLAAMLARDQPPPAVAGSAPPPPVVAELPGGADLAAVGVWASAPDYGQVWYPPVAAGWVPYRQGHWAYIAPWGWTWVDNAPWGFAPFHYGRWAYIGTRWGWVPGSAPGVAVGVAVRPIYAPALVTFFGVGPVGVGVGVGVGAAIGASVGWCPLGPGEVYHPWYRASPQYVRNVNARVTNVTNITTVNNVTINTYRNARYATVVPAATLAESRPVAGAVRPVTPQELAAARPVVAREPLRPTAATAGVTPGVARQLHIAPAPGVAAPRVAPGPAVRPVAPAAAGRPAVVPLRPAATPAVGRPAQPVMPAAPGPHGGPAAAPLAQPVPAVVRPGGTPVPPAAPVAPPAQHPAPGVTPAPQPRPGVAPALQPPPPGSPLQHPPPAAGQPAVARPPIAGAPPPHPAEVQQPVAPVVQRPAAPPAVARPEPAARPAAEPAPAPRPPPSAGPAPVARPAPQPRPEERRPEEKRPGQP